MICCALKLYCADRVDCGAGVLGFTALLHRDCMPLWVETHDQLMEQRPTYGAGFALDITLGFTISCTTMTKHIYKYAGPDNIDRVFATPGTVTLKCSLPKEFNDPYELFLTIDFDEEPGALAFYKEAIGNLRQVPTTCFSRSPAVIPMWAHYARNLEGFAVELDEEQLREHFPESVFGDVDYRDTPDSALTDTLYRAYQIGKPRYVYFLNQDVFSAAYYTKTTCWSYEQERRMVIPESETRKAGDLTLIDFPSTCVSAIICGPRTSEANAKRLADIASTLNCKFYSIGIGRTSAIPFFISQEGTPHTFDGTAIRSCPQYCASCREPNNKDDELCSWCQIEDDHERDAAARNPFRMYARYGMLDSYIKDMNEIGHRARKK